MSHSPLRSLPALLALALLALCTLAPGGLAASLDTGATLAAPQAVIELTAAADTAVLSWAPDSNFGSANILQFTYGGPDLSFEARTLVRFDLAGLPAGTVIDSAVLELWQEDPAQSPLVTAGVYQAGSAWGELSATWQNQPGVLSPGLSVTFNASSGWKGRDVTVFARSWLSTPSGNYGVVIRGPASGEAYNRFFTSREGANKPRLRVTYHLADLCAHVTEIPQAECDALVALYNGANGPGWTHQDNWLATLTPCSWYGVRCAGGHVIQLSLYSNSLGGAIPAQLGDLTGLQFLELWGNQLSGVIPPQLGDLTGLIWLSLAFNQLSGAIPAQLGDLANLETLGLHANRLSGAIPAHLGDLAHLQILTLNANQFSGAIPAQLCNPPYVAVGGAPLNLGYNALTSGPACIAADDPDWAQTQTVPPASLSAVLAPPRAARLSWTPILYTGDGGYYEVFYASTPGGALTRHGATANKSAAGYLAGNLTPGQTYYFKVRTFTPAHGEQQNALTSVWSAESAPVVVPTGNTPTPTRTRTATPTATRTGGVTPSPTSTPTATGASAQCLNSLRNGDFEAGGLAPWATDQPAGLGSGRGAGHGGWLGGAVNSDAELFQEVAIPASANLGRLAFWWRADAAGAQPGDQLKLLIQYGAQAEPVWTGTANGPLGAWRRQEVDVGAYRGMRVLLTFHAHNDAGVATTFRVDDVSLPVCGHWLYLPLILWHRAPTRFSATTSTTATWPAGRNSWADWETRHVGVTWEPPMKEKPTCTSHSNQWRTGAKPSYPLLFASRISKPAGSTGESRFSAG